jgi:hypothetical protein
MLKKIGVALVGLALALGLLTVPAAASPDTEGVAAGSGRGCERAFNETVRRFDDAFLGKRLEEFVSYYHKDSTQIAAGGRLLTRKDDIVASFRGLFATDFVATFTIVKQVVDDCRTAVVVSDFLLEFPSTGARFEFLNSLTWIREHGKWQVLMDQNTLTPTS